MLAEDIKLCPTAQAVFGSDSGVSIKEKDAWFLSETFNAPVIELSSVSHETEPTVSTFKHSRSYLTTDFIISSSSCLQYGSHRSFESWEDIPHSHVVDAEITCWNHHVRHISVRYYETRLDEQNFWISSKLPQSHTSCRPIKERH